MFGYVEPLKDELKIKEYNIFRSYYCGLCKTLKKEYGFFSRLCLNYDSVFLALILSSVHEEEYKCKNERCIANPFSKKTIQKTNESLSYSAAVMTILALLKLKDDIRDEKSIKALFAYIALLGARRKVLKNYRSLYEKSKEYMNRLSSLEKEKCDIPDKLSNEFSSLMSFLFVPDFIKDENTKRILAHIGYMLGRFIYILDAFDDLEEDKKKKRFNPYLMCETIPDKESVRENLTLALSNISGSYELIDLKINKSILDNIIYLGLKTKLDNVLDKKEKDKCATHTKF